ncbi:MAG: pyruvate kinase [Candidatus Puniceispirillaceae bacterium]
MRSTKIVATLGPSSSQKHEIASLVDAGVNVFRLNFSHGSHEEQANRVRNIREIEAETGRPIAILADMQGPKYRIGSVDAPFEIAEGQTILFYLPDDAGAVPASCLGTDGTKLPLPHPEIMAALIPGARLLMDDGKLRFAVKSVKSDHFIATVTTGGMVSSRKGVNLPDVPLDVTALTDKDRLDLEFVLPLDIDWIALSFVQRAQDILDARAIIKGRAGIVAKIEKPTALVEIDGIISAADGIMVARGDLGVELPPQAVPSIQKQLVIKCRSVGKPVIVATQMLESMIKAPTPTRAEASDVAGAVFEGADAVMLSAETAAGDYPRQAVEMMAAIAGEAEAHIAAHENDGPPPLEVENSIYHAVAEAAARLADVIDAAAIIVFTASGNTAVRIARERPKRPILVLSPSVAVERKLQLLWGVQTSQQAETGYEDAVDGAIKLVLERGIAQQGQSIVMVSGLPFGLAGSTNALRVIAL